MLETKSKIQRAQLLFSYSFIATENICSFSLTASVPRSVITSDLMISMLIGIQYSGRPFMKHLHERTLQAQQALQQSGLRFFCCFFTQVHFFIFPSELPRDRAAFRARLPTRELCPVKRPESGTCKVVSKRNTPGKRARRDKSELKMFGSSLATYGGFSLRSSKAKLFQMKNNPPTFQLAYSLES